MLWCSMVVQCQNKEGNNRTLIDSVNKSNKIDMVEVNKIENMLKKQSELETEQTEGEYILTTKDLDILSDLLIIDLKNHAYKIISDSEFISITNNIFGINTKCPNYKGFEQRYLVYHGNIMDGDQETLNSNLYEPYVETGNLFFDKKNKLITYFTLLKNIVSLKNKTYSLHTPPLIISRNKYLFNDDKASFVWLKFNDKPFLESLVKTFGYVKNKELLQWVLENNYKNIQEFEKILWNEKCDGKIIFNKEVIDIIQLFPKEKQKEYLIQISNYILEEMQRTQSVLKNNFSQEAEILGKLSYYGEKIGEKIDMPYQCFQILTINEGGKEFEEEFKRQNYYNIPDFKDVWNETKTGGIRLQGMDEPYNNGKIQSKERYILRLFDRPDFSSFSREIIVKGDVEILHNISGWDFIKADGITGYLPTPDVKKEKPNRSFLADEAAFSQEKKSFWRHFIIKKTT